MNSSKRTFIPPAGLATPTRKRKLISEPIALQWPYMVINCPGFEWYFYRNVRKRFSSLNFVLITAVFLSNFDGAYVDTNTSKKDFLIEIYEQTCMLFHITPEKTQVLSFPTASLKKWPWVIQDGLEPCY